MNVTLSRRRKGIWIGLISLIMLSNYLLYALPIVPAAPKEVVLGSLLDCMFVIPIITYFFIIRKRYSLTYIVPVVIAGYIFARFIIPSDYLQDFSYVSYIIVAGEIAFVCLELFLLYKIVRKLPTIIKKYKEYKSEYSSFSYAIDAAFDATMKRNKLIDIIVTECKLIYYAFLSWREKVPEGEYVYSYHKKDWCNRCIYHDHPCDLNRKYWFSLFATPVESSNSMDFTYFKCIRDDLFYS